MVLFRDVSNLPDTWTESDDGRIYSTLDVVPTLDVPSEDFFRIDKIIGDARLDGQTQKSPAWKAVTLQSQISASKSEDEFNEIKIPQISITAKYKLITMDATYNFNPEDIRELLYDTDSFIDDRKIGLMSEDPVIYIEEVNTELLTENFEIEVFNVDMDLADITCLGYDCDRTKTERAAEAGHALGTPEYVWTKDTLNRKYFEKDIPQIVDGLMVWRKKRTNPTQQFTTSSVEYYFDLLVDKNIKQEVACRGLNMYNKQSYYIDLDFDCHGEKGAKVYFDIYGSESQPEICLD